MNNHHEAKQAYRFRYVLRYTTWVWSDKELSNHKVDRQWSVPMAWMGAFILWVMREQWFVKGDLLDSVTGKVLYHVRLAGLIFGDGRAHLVAGAPSD